MDGPGISAVSDLKLLFSTSTHFRGHFANSTQNKDMMILIEAMCNAAQARLGESASPSAMAQRMNVDLYSARLADHLNYQEPNAGPTPSSDPAWAYVNGPSASLSFGCDGSFERFPTRFHSIEESPKSEFELGSFN
jgi:hypothetical protein